MIRNFAIVLIALTLVGFVGLLASGFSPASNPIHLFMLVFSGIQLVLAGFLILLAKNRGITRGILTGLAILILLTWALLGYICYKQAVQPGIDDKSASSALEQSGLYDE